MIEIGLWEAIALLILAAFSIICAAGRQVVISLLKEVGEALVATSVAIEKPTEENVKKMLAEWRDAKDALVKLLVVIKRVRV